MRRSSSPLLMPFASPMFSRVWVFSLASNLGMSILAVGSAWWLTINGAPAEKIALVQTAVMLPMMILSLVAGALADTHDRRLISLLGLGISLVSALLLTWLAYQQWLSPHLLLLLIFGVGVGNTVFSLNWQSLVRDLVDGKHLQGAIALNSINFNLARSLGPTLGGVTISLLGVLPSFLVGALLYIPIILIFVCWRSNYVKPEFPHEKLRRAMGLGLLYVFNTDAIRTVQIRVILMALSGSAVLALLPILVNQKLGQGAWVYGLILGALGVGAVLGSMVMPQLRDRLSDEDLLRVCGLGLSAALIVMALSPWVSLTCLATLFAGVFWTLPFAVCSVSVQTICPRWVVARVLALYHAGIAGGVAVGSWLWGACTEFSGVSQALVAAGVLGVGVQLIGLKKPVPQTKLIKDGQSRRLPDMKVGFKPEKDDGPVFLSVRYRVAPEAAVQFQRLMESVKKTRRRNGADTWKLLQDLSDPDSWVEEYSFPTWVDYLRQRDRFTDADLEALYEARANGILVGELEIGRFLMK